MEKTEKLGFETALKYPFNRAKGMLNILWLLLPIIGWFALIGYTIKIVQGFINGQFKQLPVFSFKDDLKLGFFMFIKSLPFVIFYIVLIVVLDKISPLARGLAEFFLGLFVVPMLSINFIKKETIESFFEVRILNSVFNNLGDYLMSLLKSVLLGILFLIMSLILVGIPAGIFTKNIFLIDFYRRKIK